jgi:hypothetical protein
MRDGTVDAFVERLKPVPGIVAIVVGGSRARGTADTSSDTDLGLYYHRHSPLNIAVLDAVATECDDHKSAGLVTAICEWSPWINGGDWNRPRPDRRCKPLGEAGRDGVKLEA